MASFPALGKEPTFDGESACGRHRVRERPEPGAVQVCTGVMKFGYGMVKDLCEGLLAFMEGKGFDAIDDFKGLSLPYFTTHAELVRMQLARKAEEAAAKERAGMVKSDAEWDGDDFVKQSDALARKPTS